MDAREARAEPLLELAERGSAEIRAVVRVDPAVVAVGLDVVHLADVEQLRAAGCDDRDLLDGQGVLAATARAGARARAPAAPGRPA